MVTLELNLVKEVIEFTNSQMMFVMAIVISFIGSIYSKPEAWGLMGLAVMQIKSSPNTKIKKGGKTK